MCHLFGRAVEVSATIATVKEPIESEDTCAATVRFEDGALVSLSATMTSHRSANGFDVVGELGSTHLPWAFESIDSKWREPSAAGAWDAHPSPPAPDAGTESGQRAVASPCAHAPYVAAVLEAIAAGAPLPVGPDESRAALEVAMAIYASALGGRSVALPLDAGCRVYRGVTTLDYDGRQRRPHAVRSVGDSQAIGARS
jgi:predicted dehydrogenase